MVCTAQEEEIHKIWDHPGKIPTRTLFWPVVVLSGEVEKLLLWPQDAWRGTLCKAKGCVLVAFLFTVKFWYSHNQSFFSLTCRGVQPSRLVGPLMNHWTLVAELLHVHLIWITHAFLSPIFGTNLFAHFSCARLVTSLKSAANHGRVKPGDAKILNRFISVQQFAC